MITFKGLGLHLGNLSCLSSARSRSGAMPFRRRWRVTPNDTDEVETRIYYQVDDTLTDCDYLEVI